MAASVIAMLDVIAENPFIDVNLRARASFLSAELLSPGSWCRTTDALFDRIFGPGFGA